MKFITEKVGRSDEVSEKRGIPHGSTTQFILFLLFKKLKYSYLIMFQVYSKVIQLFFFTFFSVTDYYKILNIIFSELYSRILLFIYFILTIVCIC